jgi:hypothetical protein
MLVGLDTPENPGVVEIAIDATDVHFRSVWTGTGNTGNVMKIPLEGGTATTHAPDEGWFSPLAVDATRVVWVSNSASAGSMVRTVPLGGGTPTTIATAGSSPYGVALDDSWVYWTVSNYTSPGGAVLKAPLSGGAAVALATGQTNPREIAVTSNNVYWVNYGDSPPATNGALMRALLDGGNPTTLAANQCGAGALAIDATHAYWTYCSGTIKRIPLDGGNEELLVDGQEGWAWEATALTLDDENVYWTMTDSVWRIPKSAARTP